MTEDDTFNVLRGKTLTEIVHLCNVQRRTGEGHTKLRAYKVKLLRDNGYTYDQLCKHMTGMVRNGEDILE